MICKHILLIMLLNEPKLILLHTVKSLQVLLCITNYSIKQQSFIYIPLNDQTVLFLTIQFSISHLFAHSLNISSIWPIDRTLSGATIQVQSEPGSNDNKGVLCIPQSSSITGTSPSDWLVWYPGHSLCYIIAEWFFFYIIIFCWLYLIILFS